MPTYEYHCDACGNDFEQFQSITAAPTRKCPKCGKLKVRRLISAGGGMIFKGSGFYITDYRSEGYASAAKADTAAPAGESKSDIKGDAKPESKSQSKLAETKADTKVEAKPAAKSESPAPPKSEPKASKSAKKK